MLEDKTPPENEPRKKQSSKPKTPLRKDAAPNGRKTEKPVSKNPKKKKKGWDDRTIPQKVGLIFIILFVFVPCLFFFFLVIFYCFINNKFKYYFF